MRRMRPNNLTSPVFHSDGLLTIKEGCQLLRVGTTKLYELINAGAIEVIHLGSRSTRIKRSSIERLLANGLSSDAAE